MFRKSLALLLVLSWVILFGTVIIESLDGFGSQSHRSAQAHTWSAKPAAVQTDNTIESARYTGLILCTPVGAITTAELPVVALTNFHRYFKLHKVHQVFLI
jgi:hypothetical protein